ncbi:MAG: hypothetical protein ACOC3F_00790 [Desulfosudaceae bacterium]
MRDDKSHKPCFGILDRVFPMQPDGLRETPAECLACPDKTACLAQAIHSKDGLQLTEEKVDRAYASGNMGFLERWARRKSIQQKKRPGRRRKR